MEGTPHVFGQVEYNKVLTAFVCQSDYAGAGRVWAAMQRESWQLRQRDYGVLVGSCCRQGDVEGAEVGSPVLGLRGLPLQGVVDKWVRSNRRHETDSNSACVEL